MGRGHVSFDLYPWSRKVPNTPKALGKCLLNGRMNECVLAGIKLGTCELPDTMPGIWYPPNKLPNKLTFIPSFHSPVTQFPPVFPALEYKWVPLSGRMHMLLALGPACF